MILFIFGFILATLISLWIYTRITMHKMIEASKNIPGPKPLPLIGDVLEFGTTTKDLFLNLIRLAKEYGTIYRSWFGPNLSVMITNPDYIEVVLSSPRILDKAWSYKYVEPWLGTGLLTGTGQKWKSHRKLITPTFHFTILKQFVDVFNANTDILVTKLCQHVNGAEFNVYPYITLCALDNICETAMGLRVNAQNDTNSEYVNAIRKLCDLVMFRSFRPWLFPDFIFNLTSYGKLQAKCLAVLHNTTMTVLQSRKKEYHEQHKNHNTVVDSDTGVKKRMAFLDLLIQSSEDGAVLTDEDIREEIDTLMFEGHDTSASSMSFTCWALANHQDVQDRVVAELKNIFGESDRPPTYDDIQEMKYLEMVIKESLRLYPSVPLYGRKLQEDVILGDYNVPSGTNVFVLSYLMHRNAEYFTNPEVFNPDRFSAENSINRHPYCYIPFAAGPRNCVGQKFAMLEIKVSICQLLRSYKLLSGETPLDITNEIVLKSTTGINIKLQER